MHEELKTEGIVLRSQDYQERHRLITLFSPQGLLRLIVKGISPKNARLLSLTSPFCHGEYLYRQGRSDLLQFQDGTVCNDHLIFRQRLQSLQTAGVLANAILASQLPGKSAPDLFLLYRSFHKQVHHFQDSTPLIASFYLKLLKHEGLLCISPLCTHCEINSAQSIYGGESFCSQHATQGGISFSHLEWDLLLNLDNAKHFKELSSLTLPASFSQKIKDLFHSRLV